MAVSSFNFVEKMMKSNNTEHISILVDRFKGNMLFAENTKTGFTLIDEKTKALISGIYVFAGRPGIGKTAFMLSMALNMCRNENLSVMICSLEMSSTQLFKRILQMTTKIENIRNLQFVNEEEAQDFLCQLNHIKKLNLFINDAELVNIERLLQNIEELILKHKLNIVFIDYIQLLTDSFEQQIPEYVLSKLNDFAVKQNLTIVFTSQLPREVDDALGKKPLMEHLDKVGEFRKYAKGIGLLYRQENKTYYNELEKSKSEIIKLNYLSLDKSNVEKEEEEEEFDPEAELDYMFPNRHDDDFDEDSMSYDSVFGED